MAAGKVAEAVAGELDLVADDIAQVAATTRRLDGRLVSSVGVSVGIGVGLGIYFGYRYAKRKLRNEIYAEAEKDIEMIRDHYQRKLVALERDERPAVEAIVKERGYTSEDLTKNTMRPTKPPVPVDDAEPVKLPEEIAPAPVASSRRHLTEAPVEPYLISEPEFLHNESGYAQVNYTYYADDDVLVDDDDPRSILSNREELIGRDAAHELANSSDSSDETYVRNPRLELEMIIHHVQRSWDEEVLGLDPNESG